MKRNLNRLFVAAVLAVAAGSAVAEQRETPPPGMGKYVVVLWQAGTPVPGEPEKRMNAIPEPDIEKAGGRVLARIANRRVVYLPFAAARQLQRHEAVAYVQRIWMGESLESWDERATSAAAPKITTESDTNLEWGPKAYTYDGSGNITRFGTDEYTYDSAGRLIRTTVNGKTQRFKYDAFGNLVRQAVDGAAATDIPVDPASNRLIGPEYDAAGNVTTRDGHARYAYDSLNMLTHYEGASDRRILYDADDERIGTIIDSLSRWTIRDLDGQILREYRGDDLGLSMLWFWEQDHIRGEGRLLGGETQEWSYMGSTSATKFGGERHYHLDHLGSVRMVTNKAGRSISQHDFYPFGATQTRTYQEPINWADPHTDGMRFAGHWRDFLGYTDVESTDYLDAMHARHYDPHVGRFLSVDPGRDWHPRTPQSWNLYTYGGNNPTVFVDPDGEAVVLVLDKSGFRLGDDGNDDGVADELQIEWYSVVVRDGYGHLTHEAIVGYIDGKPVRVYEHSAGWESPRENIPFEESLASQYEPAARRYLGRGFDPASIDFNERLNPFFKARELQCTDYCEYMQKRRFPAPLEVFATVRVHLNDRLKPTFLQQYFLGHYFYRFSGGYQRVTKRGW